MANRAAGQGDRRTKAELAALVEELRARSEHYRLIADSAYDWETWYSPDGHLLYSSPSYEQITGYPHAEYLARPQAFLEIVHPEDRALFARHLEVHLPAETGPLQVDFRIITKAGEVRHLNHWCQPVFAADGRYLGRRACNRDISIRARAKAALRESEARYRAITEAVTDYVYTVTVVDGRAVATRHSPTCLGVTGYSPEDFAVDPYLWLAMVVPDDRAAVEDQARRALLGEAVAPLAHRIIRKDGQERWIRNTMVLERDDVGRVVAYDGLIRDITDAKLAELELAYHQRQLEETVRERTAALRQEVEAHRRTEVELARMYERVELAARAGRMGIWDWDVVSGELLWDERMYELYGRQRRDVVSTYDAFLGGLLPADRAAVDTAVKQALRGERDYDTEFRIQWPDGTVRTLKAYGQVVRDAAGQPIRMTGVNYDISESKRLEHELRQAKEAAEAACIAKSEFLANMGHEIRTPMNAILGMTRLTMETGLSAMQREYLEAVLASAKTLFGLVNDILDFVKIDAGQVALLAEVFSPGAMARDVVQLLSGQAAAKGLVLECELAEELPAALIGDEPRLRQILTNLVGNAIKFTASGSVRVMVRVAARGKETVALLFAVSDTGPGIAGEDQQRIFERFVQVDGSTTRRHGGTGLGLAICQRLVRMMGGEISVESELGQGATFSFQVDCGRYGQWGGALPA